MKLHSFFTPLFLSCLGLGSSAAPSLSYESRNQLVLNSLENPPQNTSLGADNSNLIFASFAGLLQQWPNTFAYSGHSIIAGLIPASTRLYHGLSNGGDPPQDFEWLAFDPEMSYAVHTQIQTGQVEILTYVARRPLQVIYIDGQSASIGPGYMDSQSVLVNGTVEEFKQTKDRGLSDEYRRAKDLCRIGKEKGFEGVVRMNAGFEVIWCDFKQGIELIDRTNATDPFSQALVPQNETTRSKPNLPDSPNNAFYNIAGWEFVQSAVQYYQAPGEVRVELDPSTFISFYDRIESLSQKRTKDGTSESGRSKHTLYGISSGDAQTISDRLTTVLIRKNAEKWQMPRTHLDWRSVALSITQRYSRRLEELAFKLKSNQTDPISIAFDVRWMTYGMLIPYVDFTNFSSTDLKWAEGSVEKCATAFTAGEQFEYQTESIKMIIGAIEGTLGRLCGTLVDILGQTLALGLPVRHVEYSIHLKDIDMLKQVERWRVQIDELMNWLGWSTWGGCEPGCAPNEICLIPMWAAVYIGHMPKPGDVFAVCQPGPTAAYPTLRPETSFPSEIIDHERVRSKTVSTHPSGRQ